MYYFVLDDERHQGGENDDEGIERDSGYLDEETSPQTSLSHVLRVSRTKMCTKL